MKIRKLVTREALLKLKRNDRLLVHWKEGSTAYKKGEVITMTRIYGLNHIEEVIVRRKDNLYFSIDRFTNGESVAKEVYLIEE